jgi:hypothetical protein
LERSPGSTRADRLCRRTLAVLAVAGVVLLIDGALRGELRHRMVGVAIGLALSLPFASLIAFGERSLRYWRKALLSVLVSLVALGMVEVLARAFDLSAISVAELEPDPVLGHARRPGRGGMDAWGYRNAGVPERADIVGLGDSQTFGANIRAEDTWPQALARLSGLSVHNLSQGGYGPLQYLALSERALRLRPRAVVVGFYFGNDLPDAQRFAGLEHWAALRDPDLAYSVPDDLWLGDLRSLNLSMALLDGLQSHSRLAGCLAEHLRLRLKIHPATAGLFDGGARLRRLDLGRISTCLVPADRLPSVDLRLPEVRDGLRITGRCLDGLREACRAGGAELVLLLLPTKEAVYARLLEERGEARARDLQELQDAEREATEAVARLARERGVHVVDPTARLVSALRAGIPGWPSNGDGHFSPQGCEVLADALWSELDVLLEAQRTPQED